MSDSQPHERAQSGLELIALALVPVPSMSIVPAPPARPWMTATDRHFANRCLPLRIANQCGWELLSGHRFRAIWDGSDNPAGVKILYLDGARPYPAASKFGYGIITFQIPYLFRTPPGYNLLARGPANRPKDGVSALEGLVETDWTVATFTMNWKITRPNHLVEFCEGEPICMILPQRRDELETFAPALRSHAASEPVLRDFERWSAGRSHFLSRIRFGNVAGRDAWEKHYFFGKSPGDGPAATAHRFSLRLKPFEER